MRHGAKQSRTTCRYEGCKKMAVRGGVCVRHGAKLAGDPLQATAWSKKQGIKGAKQSKPKKDADMKDAMKWLLETEFL